MLAPNSHTMPNPRTRRTARPLPLRARASALLASALVLVVAACSGDEASSPVTTPVETVASEPPAIPLLGADGDPAARAAFAIVESAFAAYNAGDMETWAFWREHGLTPGADVAYDRASESQLEVAQCTYRGLGGWNIDEVVTGHGFDCDATLSDAFLRPAGVELEMVYNWVVAEDLASSLAGSNEDFGFRAQVMQEYRDWLTINHPDVESTITWGEVGFPTPESVPAAAEHIDEFVAASDVYPLTAPIPPGGYGGPLVAVVVVQDGSAREGDMSGVQVWQLPDAPDGSRPDQAWLAVGSGPDGSIYVSGHDHTTNSMLYRLDPQTGDLAWVGDARTASTAVDNWEQGETAEKFHTRPTHHDGRIYVATLDKSSIDEAFLSTRGFHWYAYDLASEEFVDLSADEPGGVGAEHLQVVTLTADPVNDRIYAMTVPDNQLLYYEIADGRTTVVGTLDEWDGYFYSNRFMWTDSRGNVYITGGTERSQWNQGEDAAVLDSVWRYTPDTGFEDTGFPLQTMAAIEVGQWNAAHDMLYVSDDMGHIYRFTDAAATWEYLGRPDFPAGETPDGNNKVWVFQLDPDEATIYLGRSDNSGQPNEIWEFDIDTGTSSMLAELPDLDATAGSEAFITGYDSWDDDGNFYISSFSMYDDENTYLIGIDPDQIRASKPTD